MKPINRQFLTKILMQKVEYLDVLTDKGNEEHVQDIIELLENLGVEFSDTNSPTPKKEEPNE